MNRSELQEIAKIRRREAKVLLDSGNYNGAYYLCGYVIECALKACIAKQTKKYEFPDKNTVDASYTHNLEKLVGIAELTPKLQNEININPSFGVCWAVVKDWNESSRYNKYLRRDAMDIYKAVVCINGGVFRWIKQFW